MSSKGLAFRIVWICSGLAGLICAGLVLWLDRSIRFPWNLLLVLALICLPAYLWFLILLSRNEQQPTAQEAGIPEDQDLPEGVFAFRFWTGSFSNKPAAILVDPHQDEILFINCLKYFHPFGTSIPRVRMKTDQIRRIEQATDRGIVALRIYTPQGFVEVHSGKAYDAPKHSGTPRDATLENFDQLGEYLLANCPGDPWLQAAKNPWVARLILGISGGIAITVLVAAMLPGAGIKDASVLFLAVLAAFLISTIILIQIAAWLGGWFRKSPASMGDRTPSPLDSGSP